MLKITLDSTEATKTALVGTADSTRGGAVVASPGGGGLPPSPYGRNPLGLCGGDGHGSGWEGTPHAVTRSKRRNGEYQQTTQPSEMWDKCHFLQMKVTTSMAIILLSKFNDFCLESLWEREGVAGKRC